MSNPRWLSHRIGGPRQRRVWRLTPGASIRSMVDRDSWGEVAQVRPAPWSILHGTAAPLPVRLDVRAVIDCGGRLRNTQSSVVVDHRVAAHTAVDTRILEGRSR